MFPTFCSPTGVVMELEVGPVALATVVALQPETVRVASPVAIIVLTTTDRVPIGTRLLKMTCHGNPVAATGVATAMAEAIVMAAVLVRAVGAAVATKAVCDLPFVCVLVFHLRRERVNVQKII